jgi:hypothetical protein
MISTIRLATFRLATSRRIFGALALCLTLLLVLFLQFRAQIFNHFTVLYGDRYDAAIMTTILEHWSNVVRGVEPWSQLNYFYPYTKTLGHTDGYFLIGLIYALLRPLGYDPFLTTELSNMVLKTIGFAACMAASRQIFRLPFWTSLLVAALFTFSNSLTNHGQRLQLATVAFAPVLALLMWHAIRALYAEHRRRFIGFGAAAGVMLGAWSVTCFYMTWFFIFFSTWVFAFLLYAIGGPGRKVLAQKIVRQKLGVAVVVLVTIAALLPLLTVYLPKSQETGMRPIETVLSNTVPLQGIVQVGNENLLFGKIYNRFLAFVSPGYAPNGEYYNTGIAPLLFVFFVLGCVQAFRKAKHDAPPSSGVLLPAVCAATIFSWLLTLNVAGHSAWTLVYKYFPGARALSVVSAYQMFLVFPVLAVAGCYLSTLRVRLSLLMILVLLLGLEEINDGYIALVRADEVKRVDVPAPPRECTAFFVSGWNQQATATPMSEWINNHYAHNVSAMLIAELHHLPTINGVASFNPPDWNFENPNAPDYINRIRDYAQRHHVSGLCKLDLEAKRWDQTW